MVFRWGCPDAWENDTWCLDGGVQMHGSMIHGV